MSGFVLGTALLGLAVLVIGRFAVIAFDERRDGKGFALVVLIAAIVCGWFGYVWMLGEVAS